MLTDTLDRPTRRPVRDTQLAEARTLARECAEELAADFAPADADRGVGEWQDAIAEGDRVVTHRLSCTLPGYVGWHWAVTLARASRSKTVTVSEVSLVAGEDALLAPEWVPWSERIEPGDLGVGDLLATAADDDRLVPGYTAVIEPDSPQRDFIEADSELDDSESENSESENAASETSPSDYLASEYSGAGSLDYAGLGRARVLSQIGIDLAATRWYEGEGGPDAPIARAAPAQCATCGFLLPMRGSLSSMFGVCANEWSPSDGHVVSYDHGCGAHSEAPVEQPVSRVVETVVDELRYDPFLDDDRDL